MSEENEMTHSVEVAPGVKVDSSMTPEERFAVILKAHNGVVEEKTAPAQWHTNATIAEYQRRDLATAKAKAPPPSAVNLDDTSNPNKVEEFNKEMREKGLQQSAPAPTGPAEIDQRAYDKLQEVYRAMTPKQREAKRATYERDLVSIYEGRKLGESMADFKARKSGVAPAAPSAPDPTAAAIEAVKNATVNGTFPHDAVRAELLSGYKIPEGRYEDIQDLIDGLKLARKRNFTQAHVSRIIAETWTP